MNLILNALIALLVIMRDINIINIAAPGRMHEGIPTLRKAF